MGKSINIVYGNRSSSVQLESFKANLGLFVPDFRPFYGPLCI